VVTSVMMYSGGHIVVFGVPVCCCVMHCETALNVHVCISWL